MVCLRFNLCLLLFVLLILLSHYWYCLLLIGDPRQDMEYERQFQSSYIVPEVIKNFLIFFQKSINEQVLFEVQNCYENG